LHKIYFYLISLMMMGSVPAMAQPQLTISPAEESLTPQIAAAPPNMTLEIGGKPVSGSIQLFNLSKAPVTLHTTVSNWDLDEKNNIRTIPPTPQSMDLWTIVSPVDFTIEPGKTQTVRFSIRPRTKPSPGEHRVILFFDQAPTDLVKDLGVKILYRLGIPIYGLVDKIERAGELHSIAMTEEKGWLNIAFDITSTGNANVRMDGQYVMWRKEDLPGRENPPMYILTGKNVNTPNEAVAVGQVSSTPVMAGTRRMLHQKIQIPKEPGEYAVIIHGILGDIEFKRIFATRVAP